MLDLNRKHSFFRFSLLYTAIDAVGAQKMFLWVKASVHHCPANYVPIGGALPCFLVSNILGAYLNDGSSGR